MEIDRRILAICKFYNIDQGDLIGWLHITSGLDMPIRVATGNGEIRIERAVVAELIEAVEESEIEVSIFDPLIAMHTTGESDNVKMRQVCDQFSRIANVTGTAVEIVHHVRKKQFGQEDHTTADARGAGSIIDAVRSARVLNVMSRAEADKFGIEDLDRARHVRVDRGKANLVPSGLAFWLRFESVDLDNHDDGGTTSALLRAGTHLILLFQRRRPTANTSRPPLASKRTTAKTFEPKNGLARLSPSGLASIPKTPMTAAAS